MLLIEARVLKGMDVHHIATSIRDEVSKVIYDVELLLHHFI